MPLDLIHGRLFEQTDSVRVSFFILLLSVRGGLRGVDPRRGILYVGGEK